MPTSTSCRKAALACVLALAACRDDSAGGDGGTSSGTGTADTTGTAAGTGADESGSTTLPPIDPDVCPTLGLDNVVDQASCPEVQGRGIEPIFADEIEMCRRLSLDLLGVAPTAADFAADCEGRPVEDIVDDFMGRPEYVKLGQRMWADKLRMTSQVTYYEYVVDLDEGVRQLYAGEILLPELAVRSATHPGFTGRFDGQDLVGYNFLAFLGRDAAPHERQDLEALWHMWEERYVEMHPIYYFGYGRVVINTIRCMNTAQWQCHSELWGHHSVVIPPVLPDDYDYEGPNVLELDALTQAQLDELAQPGVLLTMQPSFWESAADDALLRYLGYKAGVQIPLVRQVLVDMLLETGGDVRRIEREILTSQLYTMASAFPDPEGTLEEDGSPDFWHGPMKQMTAESWLDSVEKLAAIEIGSCDHRFPEVQGGRPLPDSPYEETVWHPNDYPKDDDPIWPPEANKPDFTYRDLARLLGGCPDQMSELRFTGTGVMIALAQSNIGQMMCGNAGAGAPFLHPALVPDDASAAHLDEVARHIVESITLREVPPELDAHIAAAVDGCQADAECNAEVMSFHLCSALVSSGDFVFY